MRKKARRLVIIVLSVLILAISWKYISRAVEAAILLADLTAGWDTSVLKRCTPVPERLTFIREERDRVYRGDLYRPAVQAKASVLLIPGAAEEGKDDSRLVAFATSLARSRFLVLVPDLEGMKRLQLQSEDTQEVAAFFRLLVESSRAVSVSRYGVCAFSYGVGPAILAALDSAIRNEVGFVMGIGGYYDLPQVLTYATTGYFLDQGRWRYLPPNDYGKWFFVMNNVHRLSDSSDRNLLRQIAARKMENVDADIAALAGSLGPEGRSVLTFITNRDPAHAKSHISGLPAAIREEIADLDLATKNLSLLNARLILVHGLDDNIVPYPQSVALASSVPPGQADLFLAKGLLHVDMKASLVDGWHLWRAVDALLRERDGTRG